MKKKQASKVAHTRSKKFFHSPAQPTAHSPELIFHIMNMSKEPSVSFSVVFNLQTFVILTVHLFREELWSLWFITKGAFKLQGTYVINVGPIKNMNCYKDKFKIPIKVIWFIGLLQFSRKSVVVYNRSSTLWFHSRFREFLVKIVEEESTYVHLCTGAVKVVKKYQQSANIMIYYCFHEKKMRRLMRSICSWF